MKKLSKLMQPSSLTDLWFLLGVLERMLFNAFSSLKSVSVISLGKKPGAIAFTFILYGAHSIASALVRFMTSTELCSV